MELVSFDGGLNTKAHPNYVQPNQSVVLNNADVFDGTLKSATGYSTTDVAIGKYFYKFKGFYVSEETKTSYVEYDNKLFVTTDVETKYTEDGVIFKKLGVKAPDEADILKLSVLTWSQGVVVKEGAILPRANYEYRIVQEPNDSSLITYTYLADQDTLSSIWSEVVVTFDVSGFDGVSKLYRRVDKDFILVADTIGDTLSDGLVQISTIETYVETASLSLAAVESMTHKRASAGSAGANYLLVGTNIYEHDLANNTVKILVSNMPGEVKLKRPSPNGTSSYHSGYTYYQIFFTNGSLYTMAHTLHQEVETIPKLQMCDYTQSIFGAEDLHYRAPCIRDASTYHVSISTKISKLDGNSWIALDNTYTQSITNLARDNKAYNLAAYKTSYNHAVHIVPTATDVIIARVGSGYYQRFNGALLTVDDATIVKSSNVVDVVYDPYEDDDGKTYLYYLLTSGNIHKYALGSASTMDSLVVASEETPTNSSAVVKGGLTQDMISDNILSFCYLGMIVTINTATNAINYIKLKAKPEMTSISIPNALQVTYARDSITALATLSFLAPSDAYIRAPVLTGSFKYLYTLSDTSTESSVSNTSSLEVNAGNIVIDTTAASETELDNLLIYRNGGADNADPNYYLVTTLPTDTEKYIDNTEVTTILGGNIPLQGANTEAKDDLRFLTYHRGRLFGASQRAGGNAWVYAGDSWYSEDGTTWIDSPVTNGEYRLYFSGLGEPTQWAATDYLLFPEPITGIGSTPNGLVVFSDGNVYVVLGTTLDELSILNISAHDGCSSHESIQAYKGQLLFMGRSGLQQTNGGSVQNISRSVIDGLYDEVPRYSAIVDDIYYVDTTLGILAYDFRVARLLYTYDKASIDGMANIDGNLELSSSGRLLTIGAQEELSLSYLSGKLTSGQINALKEYNNVWVRFTGVFTLRVLIDDIAVGSFSLASNSETTYRYTVPKTKNKGYHIQFSVSGKGTILGIEFSINLRRD